MHEYNFAIDLDDDKGVPFGPVNKDNMDVSRLIVDFTSWLDPSESIVEILHLMTTAQPAIAVPPWQANYPLDETSTVLPVDTYPMTIFRHELINSGLAVLIDVSAGTPGLTYAVSFVIVAGVTLRRREVDILMTIDMPVNPAMVGLGLTSAGAFVYPLIITGSTALPMGFAGSVYINNQTSAPMNVILPPNPQLGDRVLFIDIGHTNHLYPVTFLGDPSAPWIIADGIYGSDGWVSFVANDNISFEWTGAYWALGTRLVPFLG